MEYELNHQQWICKVSPSPTRIIKGQETQEQAGLWSPFLFPYGKVKFLTAAESAFHESRICSEAWWMDPVPTGLPVHLDHLSGGQQVHFPKTADPCRNSEVAVPSPYLVGQAAPGRASRVLIGSLVSGKRKGGYFISANLKAFKNLF